MLQRARRGYPGILALIALFFCLGIAPARANTIGVVNRESLLQEYLGLKNYESRMRDFIKAREQTYQALQLGMGLDAEKFREYERLTKHEVIVDAQRVATLQEEARANVTLYRTLEGKGADKLTEEEKAQFATLETALKTAVAILEERRAALVQQIRDEDSRLSAILRELEDKAIEKVAKQRKLAIVLNRDVQMENEAQRFVLWGGVDITGDVAKLLNAEFKESLLDAQPAKPEAKPAK